MRTALAIVAAVCCLGRFATARTSVPARAARHSRRARSRRVAAARENHGRARASVRAAWLPTWAQAEAGSPFAWRTAWGRTARVYAEDVQRQMIEATRRRVGREGLSNVRRFSALERTRICQEPVDAVLIVDTYHEMEQPAVLLRNVAASLKPKGRIGIVDFKRDGYGPGPSAGGTRRSRSRSFAMRKPPVCACSVAANDPPLSVPARLRQTRAAQ